MAEVTDCVTSWGPGGGVSAGAAGAPQDGTLRGTVTDLSAVGWAPASYRSRERSMKGDSSTGTTRVSVSGARTTAMDAKSLPRTNM